MICIHQKPEEDCIHCLREKVLELTDRLDQMTNFGALKPRAADVMFMAIEQGVRAGVRRGWKHSDDPEPDDGKVVCIVNCTIEAMEEWFHVQ